MFAVGILEFVGIFYLSFSNFIQQMNFSVVSALSDLWKAAFRVNRTRARFRADDLLVAPGAPDFLAPRMDPVSASEGLAVIIGVACRVRLSIRTGAGASVHAGPKRILVDHILIVRIFLQANPPV